MERSEGPSSGSSTLGGRIDVVDARISIVVIVIVLIVLILLIIIIIILTIIIIIIILCRIAMLFPTCSCLFPVCVSWKKKWGRSPMITVTQPQALPKSFNQTSSFSCCKDAKWVVFWPCTTTISSEMQLCQACWLEGCEGFFWSRLDLSAQHTFPTFDLSCIMYFARCPGRGGLWTEGLERGLPFINKYQHQLPSSHQQEMPKKNWRTTNFTQSNFDNSSKSGGWCWEWTCLCQKLSHFRKARWNHFKPWFPFQSRHSLPTQGHPIPRNTKFARLERIFTTLFPGRSQNLYFFTGWLWVTDFVRRPHFENFEPLNSLWSNLSTMEPGKAEQLWI